MGVMPSPLKGSAGNAEFLVYARSPHRMPDGPAGSATDVDRLIDEAVAEAAAGANPGEEP